MLIPLGSAMRSLGGADLPAVDREVHIDLGTVVADEEAADSVDLVGVATDFPAPADDPVRTGQGELSMSPSPSSGVIAALMAIPTALRASM